MRSAVLAFALIACSAEEPHFPCDLRADPAFTGTDRCLIVEAAARWREATNGYVDIRPADGALVGHRILLEHGLYMKAPSAEGVAQVGGSYVWIFEDLLDTRDVLDRDRAFVTVVMHELGHHVGLNHASAGLMQVGSEKPCVMQADLDQLCAVDGECFTAKPCEPPPTWCR